MAQAIPVVLGYAGSYIGGIVGGPFGAAIGYAIGSAIGSYLIAPDAQNFSGPRIDDFYATNARYGASINELWGRARLDSNLIYASEIEERSVTENLDGGKGGGDSGTATTFTYHTTFAVALGEGPIDRVDVIFIDGKRFLPQFPPRETSTGNPDGVAGAGLKDLRAIHDLGFASQPFYYSYQAVADAADGTPITCYYGTEEQLPAPAIEAFEGVGNVPAYRGICYLLFKDFDVTDYGGRIPIISAIAVRSKPTISMRYLGNEYNDSVYPNTEGGNLGSGHNLQFDYKRGLIYSLDQIGNASLIVYDATTPKPKVIQYIDLTAHCITLGPSLIAQSGDLTLLEEVQHIHYDHELDKIFMLYRTTIDDTYWVGALNPDRLGDNDQALTYDNQVQGLPFDDVVHTAEVDTKNKRWWLGIETSAGETTENFIYVLDMRLGAVTHKPRLSDDGVADNQLWKYVATMRYDPFGERMVVWQFRKYEPAEVLGFNSDPINETTGNDNFGAMFIFDTRRPILVLASQSIGTGTWDTFCFGASCRLTIGNNYGNTMVIDGSNDPHIWMVQGFEEYDVVPAGSRTTSVKVWLVKRSLDDLSIKAALQISHFQSPEAGNATLVTQYNLNSLGGEALNSVVNVVYVPAVEGIAIIGYGGADSNGLEKIQIYNRDLTELKIDRTVGGDSGFSYDMPYLDYNDITQTLWVADLDFTGWHSYKIKNEFGRVPLKTIVDSFTTRANPDTTLIDTEELAERTVEGFVRNDKSPLRNALDPLIGSFQIDTVEEDWKLKFTLRPRASDGEIVEGDVGALLEQTTKQSNLFTKRAQEQDLPKRLSITYVDRDNDYQPGNVHYDFLKTNSNRQDSLATPIAFTPSEARQLAEKLVHLKWNERMTESFTLPPKYIGITAGTVRILRYKGDVFLLRFDSVDNTSNGVINCQCTVVKTIELDGEGSYSAAELESNENYTSEAEAESNQSVFAVPENDDGYVAIIPRAARFYIFDAPLFRDKDEAGEGRGVIYYTAAPYGRSEDWGGVGVFASDNDITYTQISFLGKGAVTGSAPWFFDSTIKITHARPDTWDYESRIQVTLKDPSHSLESRTESELLTDGLNSAILGDGELIQYQNATLISAGDANTAKTYILSKLLRGLRGTEHKIKGFNDDDISTLGTAELIFLDDLSFGTLEYSESEIGNTKLLKAVSVGDTLQNVTPTSVVISGNSQLTWSPAHFKNTTRANGDELFSWIRRVRKIGEWADFQDAPLLESTSAIFDLEILASTNGPVLRTFSSIGDSAQQLYNTSARDEDLSPWGKDIFTSKVFQVDRAGRRGVGAEITLDSGPLYTRDFSEYVTASAGDPMPDWSAVSGMDFVVSTEVSLLSDVVQITSVASDIGRFISWDKFATDHPVEILCRFRMKSHTGLDYAGAATGTNKFYIQDQDGGTKFKVAKMNNTTIFSENISSGWVDGLWWWLRLNAPTAGSRLLNGRMWLDSAPEPDTWDFTSTNSSIDFTDLTPALYLRGLGGEFDYFAIDVEGNTIPVPPSP